MSEIINNWQLFSILGLTVISAVAIYIYLIVLASESEHAVRNIIIIVLLGVLSPFLGALFTLIAGILFIPFLKRNITNNDFTNSATPDSVKQNLAKYLKLSKKEINSELALVSDLRIPFTEVENAVRSVALGYGISPHLIAVERSSTLNRLTHQISKTIPVRDGSSTE